VQLIKQDVAGSTTGPLHFTGLHVTTLSNLLHTCLCYLVWYQRSAKLCSC